MLQDFLSEFESRIEFNKETGDFIIKGKAIPKSPLYQLIRRAYEVQDLTDKTSLLNEKIENGEEITVEDATDLFNLYEKVMNNYKSSIANEESFIKADLENFMKSDHKWIVQSPTKKILLKSYSNVDGYSNYEEKKAFSLLSKSKKYLEEYVPKNELFFSLCSFYKALNSYKKDTEIFREAAAAMDCDIDIYEFPDKTFASYRILLKSPDNCIYILYSE